MMVLEQWMQSIWPTEHFDRKTNACPDEPDPDSRLKWNASISAEKSIPISR